MTTGKFLNLTTAATGSNWTAFAANTPSTVLHVLNASGTSLQFRRIGDPTAVFTLPDGFAWSFRGLTNSNQIECRRADSGNTQVTISAEVELEG